MVEKNEKNKEEGKSENSKNIFGGNGNKPKFNITWLYIGIFALFLLFPLINNTNNPETTSYDEMKNVMIHNDDVKKIVIVNNKKAEIFLKESSLQNERYKDVTEIPPGNPHYVFDIGDLSWFREEWDHLKKQYPQAKDVKIEHIERRDLFGEFLSFGLPLLIFIIIWIFLFRRLSNRGGGGAGNIFSVGKSKAKLFDKNAAKTKVNFDNVAGLQEAKVEIKEIVDFLKNPKKYTELGGKIPKGGLLIGPPGTGKTLLAKAVAGEANVPFFSISGSDFVEMFVGVGASRVRDLFKQAKDKAPCIVFVDEIDAIGRARGKNAGFAANDERENTLNQLLSEMDGFGDNSGIILIAATNRVDVLDKALLRAGRFDRQINVDLPDLDERKEIFKVHLKPIKVDKKIDVDLLAKQTAGFSGADIANVANEAALIAARNNKNKVEKQDFLDAVDRIVGGLERKTKLISPEEKKTIAFHEAGHATVSWFLKHAHPLVKVTIVPRGRALGAAWYLPEERQITTVEQLKDELSATLGGRASEEIYFGEISTGALNDLERVTKQTYAMVSYFGMSDKIGNISYYDSTGGNEYSFNKPYSEKTAEEIDAEVKSFVEEAYNKAKKILSDNATGLQKLANRLLEREVIFKEDLEEIFGKSASDLKKEEMAKTDKAMTATSKRTSASKSSKASKGARKSTTSGTSTTRKSSSKSQTTRKTSSASGKTTTSKSAGSASAKGSVSKNNKKDDESDNNK